MKTIFYIIAILLVIFIGFCTQITVFVTQPLGAIPSGSTIIIWKRENTKFIDSADAICEREFGGVNLICRIRVLGEIASTSDILFRGDYREPLYLLSTDGKKYGR